jgi:hypothetical protein
LHLPLLVVIAEGDLLFLLSAKKIPYGLFRDRKTNRPALDIRRPGSDPGDTRKAKKSSSPRPV